MRNLVIPSIFTAIDQLSGPIDKMRNKMHLFFADTGNMQRVLGHTSEKALDTAKQTAIMGAAIMGPLTLGVSEAIKFEDRLADVAKTTGLVNKELETFKRGILSIGGGTRTPLEELLSFGELGGQMGVAKGELLSFVDAANKFAVAMGGDYAGGAREAIERVSKAVAIFPQTKNLQIAEGITRLGSVFNDLSAAGNATAPNINDFMTRIGNIPIALRPAATSAAAMAATLEELGLNSEVGSSGFQQFLMDAARNLPIVSAQMGVAEQAARAMLSADPTRFALNYASSLPKDPVQLARALQTAKLNSGEQLKVLGALQGATTLYANRLEMANQAFYKGSSLLEEYTRKNETAAARIGQLKNNAQALAIAAGDLLIPALNRAMERLTPFVSGITQWASENKSLAGGIVTTTAVLGGSLLAISAVSGAIGGITKATWLWNGAVAAYNFASGVANARLIQMNFIMAQTKATALGAEFGLRIMSMTMGQWALAAAGIAFLIGGINYAFDDGYDKSKRYKGVLEEQQIGFKKISQPISHAEIALNRYNKAVERYNEVRDMLNERYYLQNKFQKSTGIDKLQAGLEIIFAHTKEKVFSPILSSQVDDIFYKNMPYQRFLPDSSKYFTPQDLQEIQMKRAEDSTAHPENYPAKTSATGGKDRVEVVIRNESGNGLAVRGTNGVEIKTIHSWQTNATA